MSELWQQTVETGRLIKVGRYFIDPGGEGDAVVQWLIRDGMTGDALEAHASFQGALQRLQERLLRDACQSPAIEGMEDMKDAFAEVRELLAAGGSVRPSERLKSVVEDPVASE